jgi:hypothetical protein
MNQPIDLAAHAAQQKAQREIMEEAQACGMADAHAIVVGIQPGGEGVAVQHILVGTCATCWSMVRAEWWKSHYGLHNPEADADIVQIGANIMAEWAKNKEQQLADDMRSPDA